MRLEDALLKIAGFLEERNIPYMVIGGYANLFWGRARVTRDLDITISCPAKQLAGFVAELGQCFRLLPADPLAFIRQHRVLPLQVAEAVRADLVLAGPQ